MTETEQNKTTILWIHGFAGKANNDTVKAMRKYHPEYEILSIEVDHHAIASMKKIDAYIAGHPELTLVAGTSLGGFYAMWLTHGCQSLSLIPLQILLGTCISFLV